MTLAARIVNRWASSVLVDTGEKTWGGGTLYTMPLEKDTFIHFTLEERVEGILAAGKLLQRPPYPKFGPDEVFAISTTYGITLPSVQTSRFKGRPLKAIKFKTTAMPTHGYIEEVWDRDVPLLQWEVLGPIRAASMLRKPILRLGDQDQVRYE